MTERLPVHVGIIMDGNGRWAKAHNVPRVMGHNAGMQAMKKIVIATSNMGIKYLTVYAFSTENWKRSTEEVSGIFNLIVKYVNSELEELDANNVKINIFGQYDMLPDASVRAIDRMIARLADNDGLVFNIALNYGGRDEILRSVRDICRSLPELTAARLAQRSGSSQDPSCEADSIRTRTGSEDDSAAADRSESMPGSALGSADDSAAADRSENMPGSALGSADDSAAADIMKGCDWSEYLSAMEEVVAGLTEADISRYLWSGAAHFDVPDPDLIIRTSGEERMSNFLTWQAAYSEMMFTNTLWPDFTPEEYAEMIEAYAGRDRRFGGRK